MKDFLTTHVNTKARKVLLALFVVWFFTGTRLISSLLDTVLSSPLLLAMIAVGIWATMNRRTSSTNVAAYQPPPPKGPRYDI